jgi:5-methylcytosine-specific restriction endonuclease McrA
MNRWNIPAWLEREIILRDKSCVYCGVVFGVGNRPSWEHIVNDARIVTRENISLCCRACNSSKGVKPLEVWLESAYCKRRGITSETVAEVAKKALL